MHVIVFMCWFADKKRAMFDENEIEEWPDARINKAKTGLWLSWRCSCSRMLLDLKNKATSARSIYSIYVVINATFIFDMRDELMNVEREETIWLKRHWWIWLKFRFNSNLMQ